MKRILIIDDHPLFREALGNVIDSMLPKAELFESATISSALDILNTNKKFNLALLDLYIPGTEGFDGLITLRKQFPKLPIIIISAFENNSLIKEALDFGAQGYIFKTATGEEIFEAITKVVQGEIVVPKEYDLSLPDQDDMVRNELAERLFSLTKQQFTVLKMLREGKLNKQIAYELGVGETTIKAHVSEILRKMNVVSRTQAVIEASKIDFDSIMKDTNQSYTSNNGN